MDIIGMIRSFFSSPKNFFSAVNKDEGYKKPWLYFMIIMSAYYALALVFSIPSLMISMKTTGAGPVGAVLGIIIMLFIFIFSLALGAGLIFVSAGILHLFLLIVGAKKGYLQTFKLVCYASTPIIIIAPFIILNIIPFIGFMMYMFLAFALMIYVMVIEVIAAKVLHGLSTARAVVGVVVLPLVLVLIIFMIVAIVAVGFFLALAKSGGLTGMVTGSL